MESGKTRLIGIMALLAIYITYYFIKDGKNIDYIDYSETAQKQKITHCPEEYIGEEINAKEFFIFNSNIVWCNVFKSASTR